FPWQIPSLLSAQSLRRRLGEHTLGPFPKHRPGALGKPADRALAFQGEGRGSRLLRLCRGYEQEPIDVDLYEHRPPPTRAMARHSGRRRIDQVEKASRQSDPY